jgi:glyoxylase-like metal-dependent hydrolase (beta-lactamase superfamily II)
MPLPFRLDHINLWLVEGEAGWTVVDCGLANDETRDLWRRVFDGVLGAKPVERLVVTHFHPDHLGAAGWIADRWGAPLSMPLAEWLYGRSLAHDKSEAFVDAQVEFHRRAGFDAALLDLVRSRGNMYATRVGPIPQVLHRISDGDVLELGGRRWRVIIGTGHSPEHACLHCRELGVLISGDQVLPRISPNVSVWPGEPEADPLAQFLSSLTRLRELPAETLVLPSHGLPFVGLRRRIDDLMRHHEERLEETFAACREPLTAFELQKVLFRRELDTHQLFFAVGESIAHLHRLMGQGRIRRTLRADGAFVYTQA